MVNNYTNINKMNNHISLNSLNTKTRIFVPTYKMCMTMENEVLTLNRHKNVTDVIMVNGIPKLIVIKRIVCRMISRCIVFLRY